MRNLDGVDSDMLRKLAETGVTQRDDLAELSVDELVEITGVDEEEAKKSDFWLHANTGLLKKITKGVLNE